MQWLRFTRGLAHLLKVRDLQTLCLLRNCEIRIVSRFHKDSVRVE
jgi:hypothetical protein